MSKIKENKSTKNFSDRDSKRAEKKLTDKSALRSPKQIEAELKKLSGYIKSNYPNLINLEISYGELNITAPAEGIEEFIKFLRDDHETDFSQLIDLCGVDYPERVKRFDVVYHLLSMKKNLRVRVKTQLGEDESIHSISMIYLTANWFEREAFDLYGILFHAHPDLRRLLTDYGFEGHPLRKDFPLTGFVETRYDDKRQAVVYEPVKLKQEFRNFDFLSPWEGMDEPEADILPAGIGGGHALEDEGAVKRVADKEPKFADPDKDHDSRIL